jgi:hypothetical protein
LPQIALRLRPCLPSRLINLMCREWSALIQQLVGIPDRLLRRQRIFRDRLDAGTPIRQWPAELVPRTRLPGTSLGVSIPIADRGQAPQSSGRQGLHQQASDGRDGQLALPQASAVIGERLINRLLGQRGRRAPGQPT